MCPCAPAARRASHLIGRDGEHVLLLLLRRRPRRALAGALLIEPFDPDIESFDTAAARVAVVELGVGALLRRSEHARRRRRLFLLGHGVPQHPQPLSVARRRCLGRKRGAG